MNKNNSLISNTACLPQRGLSKHKYKFSLKMLDKTIIPSLDQAQERVKNMQKRHKWRKQKRLRILHDTYDENCRLFLSINSQKSVYAHYRSKIEELTPKSRPKCNSIQSRRYANENKMNKSINQNKKSVQINQKEQGQSINYNKNKENYRAEISQILKQVSVINKMLKDRSQKKNFLTVNQCLKGNNKKPQKCLQLKQINKIKNTFAYRLRYRNQATNAHDQNQFRY